MAATCAVCGGTGFEIRDRGDGVSTAQRCACAEVDRRDRRLRLAKIPRRYDHCTLDSFECHHPSHAPARQLAADWVERWPVVDRGLLFLGRPGTGKTHLAVGIAREVASAKGAGVLFYEQRELLRELQGTFDAASTRAESEVLGPIQDAEVLVLDDLGAGRTTPWTRDVLHDIIAHRYNNKLPLIMTSNHATGEDDAEGGGRLSQALTLRDRLGDALMSRIYEMCVIVAVEGDDYRKGVQNARIHF